MIAAMGSGSGKTIVTAGLLMALKKRNIAVRSFKCGPDYIDPMFHTRVLGVPCRNLDLFLLGQRGVLREFSGKEGADILQETSEQPLAVIEGAMGFYDGIGGTTEASAYEVAKLLRTPVILVVKPRGQSATLAAEICGLMNFRPENHITGVILNECSAALFDHLRLIIERECGEFRDRFEAIVARMEETVGIDRILACAGSMENETVEAKMPGMVDSAWEIPGNNCRIAVARDEAFSFYYESSLDAIRRAGAELIPFSPLRDRCLPANISGLYLGGGYPENYAAELSSNKEMLRNIREAIENSLPTVAECGGFMYLQEKLQGSDGKFYPMVGVLTGETARTPRLVRFGYVTLTAEANSMLFRAGESVPAHEFHHWDSTECGDGLTARKYDGRNWKCGVVNDRLYAGYPHLELGGDAPLAERLVQACLEYADKTQERLK